MSSDPFDAAEAFMLELLVEQLDSMPSLRKLEMPLSQVLLQLTAFTFSVTNLLCVMT